MESLIAQVVWEHADRWWLAGDVICRVLKYAQSFAIMSSVNMLVVLSVDRHQAIRRPLHPPPSVRTLSLSLLYCDVPSGSFGALSVPASLFLTTGYSDSSLRLPGSVLLLKNEFHVAGSQASRAEESG